jgi:hypothetical protein
MRYLNEDKTLNSKLLKISVSVTMTEDSHVPDTMLLIRCLPTVAVVGQSDRVERSQATGTILDLYIKFLPNPGPLYKNLMDLCKAIKRLKGVKHIKIERVGGRTVTYKGQSIVV